MRLIVGLVLFTGFFFHLCAQEDTMYTPAGYLKIVNNPDSVQYTRDYAFNEGIYLTYKDFRQTIAIPKSLILTRVEKNQLEFYNKLVNESDSIIYRIGTGIKIALVDSIWGYCQNNVVYKNVEGTFCRIPVFGNVSHFIGAITVEAFKNNGPFYDPSQNNGGNSMTGVPLKSKETHEFIFDFYSGKVEVASIESVDKILKRDADLYQEWVALKNRHKRSKMYMYLKRYNDRHPIFFPKA